MIIVLGSTGFVGQNVCSVLDRNNIEYKGFNSKNFDMTNLALIEEVLSELKPKYIINCAAVVGSLNYVTEHAADILDINSTMVLNLYKAVKNVSKKSTIINPIANCAYPGNLNIYTEDDLFNGTVHQSVIAYGTSRRLMVTLSQVYNMQYDIDTINLLVPNMYGPYDSTDPNKAHALNALVSKIVKANEKNDNEFVVWGSGVAIREWLYAEDFGKIIYEIISNNLKNGLSEPINIAQNSGLSIKELVYIILEKSNSSIAIKWDTSMQDGAPKKVMDDTKFKKVFKAFEFCDFERGIENTIKYYKSVYPY